MWSRLIRTTDAWAPLVARLTLAAIMFPHGA
jgi:putative oxidoreductase